MFELANAGREVRALLHLRQGKVQLVLRRWRQRRRVIEHDLAAIVALPETVGLGARSQQIAEHWPPLNVVVRHDHVNGVFRSPLRHMAVDAGRTRTCARDLRVLHPDAFLVAALADRNLTLDCFGTARDFVRVVAREARHVAALEACRLAQAVRAAGDLELVIAPRRCPGA